MLREEKVIIKVALIGAIIGLTALFILSENIELETESISTIKNEPIGTMVKVHGIIKDLRDTPSVAIIILEENNEKVKVVVFKEDRLELREKMKIEVEGRVKEYEGETEIEAEKITIIS